MKATWLLCSVWLVTLGLLAQTHDAFMNSKANAMDPTENHLLERLPRRHLARFLERCERFELVPKMELGSAGEVLNHAYFPSNGAIALVVAIHGRPPLEVGAVGRDSMLGAELLLGGVQAPWKSVVQQAGSCWRIEADELRLVTSEIAGLRSSLQENFIVQVHQRQAMASASARPRLPEKTIDTQIPSARFSNAAARVWVERHLFA